MAHKPRSSGLASVTKLRTGNRPGRPYKTLSSAVARSASERDICVLLRKRLAARIDGTDLISPAAMAALVRQFRDVDARIRAIDAAAEEAAAASGPDDDDDDDGDGEWNPDDL